MPTVGDKVLHYEIQDHLGKGAKGQVFKAFDTNLEREVALKFLLNDNVDPKLLERFTVEAKAVAKLDHPNVGVLHAQYYLSLAEKARPLLYGQEQLPWFNLLTAEHDNSLAALAWFDAEGRDVEGLRLAAALGRFWHVKNHFQLGRAWLRKFLERLPVDEHEHLRARALAAEGGLIHRIGFKVAHELFESSLRIYRQLGDDKGVAHVLVLLGDNARYHGDYRQAKRLFTVSLQLSRDKGLDGEVAYALNMLGSMARYEHDDALAALYYQESLEIRRELGDDYELSFNLNYLGVLASEQGDFDEAKALLEESLALRRQLNDKQGVASTMSALGFVARQQGIYREAVRCYRESLLIFRELGTTHSIAYALTEIAILLSLMDKPEPSVKLFGAAKALMSQVEVQFIPPIFKAVEQSLVRNHEALDEPSVDTLWELGKNMSVSEALSLALSLLS